MAAVFSYGSKGVTTARLKGSGTEPLNIGWGLNPSALTAAVTDTALFDPSTEARTAGTSSQVTTNANIPNDTYQVVGAVTAAGARVIQEVGLFDTATAAAQTTLSAAITTTGQTSISVTSAATFPGSGTYYVQIEDEVLAVTGGQGTTTWTVTRAQRGSSAATHLINTPIVGGEACAGGNMFVHADHGAVTLATGDSISYTIKLEYA